MKGRVPAGSGPRAAAPPPPPPPPPLAERRPDELWTMVAGAALVSGAIGYGIRRHGKGQELQLENVKAELLKTRDKAQRDTLVQQQERLDTRAGIEMAVGTSLLAFAIAFAAMVPLLGRNVRLRFATGVCIAPALLFSAVYSVYMAGIVSMIASSLIALALIWFVTGEAEDGEPRPALFF